MQNLVLDFVESDEHRFQHPCVTMTPECTKDYARWFNDIAQQMRRAWTEDYNQAKAGELSNYNGHFICHACMHAGRLHNGHGGLKGAWIHKAIL